MLVKDIAARAKADAYGRYLNRFGPHWVETRGSAPEGTLSVRLKPLDEYRALFEEASRFLLVQAAEITGSAGNGRALHMNAINVMEVIPPQAGATIRDAIAQNFWAVQESAKRSGREVQVHVNHPNYRWGVTAEDLAAIVDERFFEVWNGVDGDNDPGDELHPSTDEIWDIANTIRIAGMNAPPLFGVATDDTHNYHGNNPRSMPGRGWVMVRARHLTPESVIRAMRSGQFYASTGVALDDVVYDRQARKLSLRIQPKTGERFVTRFVGTRKGVSLRGKPRLDSQGLMVETTLDYRTANGPQIGAVFAEVEGVNPSYKLRGDELYVRAVVTSSASPASATGESNSQRAWTQPVGWQ
jgi:hypothetical protein